MVVSVVRTKKFLVSGCCIVNHLSCNLRIIQTPTLSILFVRERNPVLIPLSPGNEIHNPTTCVRNERWPISCDVCIQPQIILPLGTNSYTHIFFEKSMFHGRRICNSCIVSNESMIQTVGNSIVVWFTYVYRCLELLSFGW